MASKSGERFNVANWDIVLSGGSLAVCPSHRFCEASAGARTIAAQ
ncbi:hypothetical protein DSM110093_03165 [Sulfitobacter sp. DSM 110093]|nr:hypothetical protein DSM110093_03165 [Sulfitobacter sp. DSM 110093]